MGASSAGEDESAGDDGPEEGDPKDGGEGTDLKDGRLGEGLQDDEAAEGRSENHREEAAEKDLGVAGKWRGSHASDVPPRATKIKAKGGEPPRASQTKTLRGKVSGVGGGESQVFCERRGQVRRDRRLDGKRCRGKKAARFQSCLTLKTPLDMAHSE